MKAKNTQEQVLSVLSVQALHKIPPYPQLLPPAPDALDSALKRLTRARGPEVEQKTEKNLDS